jgi:hypothetical protein
MALAVLALAASAGIASAQSESDLRRENERLRTQVADLTQELDAANQRIQSLQEENSRLRDALQAGPVTSTSPLQPEPVTIDESVPHASPRALLRALVQEYGETTGELEMGDSPGDPARVSALRQIRRWVARANREHKTPIEWHVRVVESAVRVGRGYVLRLHAVDPVTHTVLGDPFDAVLSRSLASRLLQREQRFGLEDVMVLKGVLEPRIHVNEDRSEEGPFDNPRFVGPFVEFNLTVTANAMIPPPEEEEQGEE